MLFTISSDPEKGIPYTPENEEDDPTPRQFSVLETGDYIVGSDNGLFIYGKDFKLKQHMKTYYTSRIFSGNPCLIKFRGSLGLLTWDNNSYHLLPLNELKNKFASLFFDGFYFAMNTSNPDKIVEVWHIENWKIIIEPIDQWVSAHNDDFFIQNGILFSRKYGPFSTGITKYLNYFDTESKQSLENVKSGDFFARDSLNNFYFLCSNTDEVNRRPAIIIMSSEGMILRIFDLRNYVQSSRGMGYPALDSEGNIYFLVPGKDGHKVYMIKNDWSKK